MERSLQQSKIDLVREKTELRALLFKDQNSVVF